MLTTYEVIGLEYYTRRFIHLFRGSAHSRTLTFPRYLKEPMGSELRGNGYKMSAMKPIVTLRNRWTDSLS